MPPAPPAVPSQSVACAAEQALFPPAASERRRSARRGAGDRRAASPPRWRSGAAVLAVAPPHSRPSLPPVLSSDPWLISFSSRVTEMIPDRRADVQAGRSPTEGWSAVRLGSPGFHFVPHLRVYGALG